MKPYLRITLLLAIIVSLVVPVVFDAAGSAQSPALARSGSDWTDARGPTRDGVSPEKGLPEKWSPTGENLLWKAPYGARSAPIVMGNRVYLFNSAGEGPSMQERVMALDVETGKVVWEYRFNVYSSDVPPRRVAWSSPAGDPTTGNVYAFGACNELVALSPAGKLLWSRSLTDEFGAWTTHGGRTVSPIIEGEMVIVSTIAEGWGDNGQRRHRYFAFDKLTGQTIWISTPGGRPFDTTYSTPVTTTINGMRLLIAGAGDGTINALKVNTGEPVWTYGVSKRGVNPGVVMKGNLAFVSHQEENLDTNEMGLLAVVDATVRGQVKPGNVKWSIRDRQLGPASPVIDGDRYYQVDASANLLAFDVNNGQLLWEQKLGTIQKASPVFADGKIYVGTENGRFYILKPGPTGCEILDSDELEPGMAVAQKTEVGDDLIASNEQVLASVAISRGRVFLVSTKHIYAIGKKRNPALPAAPAKLEAAPAGAAVAHVQVSPVDLVVKPGESIALKVRLFDAAGRFIRLAESPEWTLEGLPGKMAGNVFTASPDASGQAGKVKATVGGVSGVAHLRVIAPLPYAEDFSKYAVDAFPGTWINAIPKYAVRELEGNKVLLKRSDNPAFQRARTFIGPAQWANYTVEADVRAVERRRQIGDAGIVAQRYQLTLFGNGQRMELTSWQIEPQRAIRKPFAWKKDTWYRLKLETQNLPGGKVRIRGKAWPTGEAEPAEWLIEHVDPIGNRLGSPGIFAYAPNDVFFDNIKVTPNR
ncbi:MAG: PQQ-binding-like beta-propeller repeat protein [Acidobacteriota bacterium]